MNVKGNDRGRPGLVSVIIPTYNRAGLIGETLASVFAQGHRPIEIIVVDDGSTDGTESVARSFESRAGGSLTLRYVRQDHSGAPAARNRGFRESKGEYIQFLDSDDLLEPHAVKGLVDGLRGAGAQVAHGDWWDVHLGKGSRRCRRAFRSVGRLSDPVTDLLARRWSASFCYLYSRPAVEASGGWDERWRANQDFGFALRVALLGATFAHVPGAIGSYRYHQGDRVSLRSTHGKGLATRMILEEAEEVLAEHGQLTQGRRRALAGHYLYAARLLHDEDIAAFHELLTKINRLWPRYRPPQIWYMILSGLLGIPRTEALLMARRRVLHHLGWPGY